MSVDFGAVTGYGIQIESPTHVAKISGIPEHETEDYSLFEMVDLLATQLSEKYSLPVQAVYLSNPYIVQSQEIVYLALVAGKCESGEVREFQFQVDNLNLFKTMLTENRFYRVPVFFVAATIS